MMLSKGAGSSCACSTDGGRSWASRRRTSSARRRFGSTLDGPVSSSDLTHAEGVTLTTLSASDMLDRELRTTHQFDNLPVSGSICLGITFCSDNDDFPADALPPQLPPALARPSILLSRLLGRERRPPPPVGLERSPSDPVLAIETYGMRMGREAQWEEPEMAAALQASLEESGCVNPFALSCEASN